MIYVGADLEGNPKDSIKAINRLNLQSDDKLYLPGDCFPKNGDQSLEMVFKIIELQKDNKIIMTLGNHEQMIHDAFAKDTICMDRDTARRVLDMNGGKDIEKYLKTLSESERSRLFDFYKNCPIECSVSAGGKQFRLVHGAPSELFPFYSYRYDSEKKFCLWHRMHKYDAIPNSSEIVVFGHTPTCFYQDNNPLEVWFSEDGKKIGLNCGSAFPPEGVLLNGKRYFGRQAFLRLDDLKTFYF